ncbi:hypothetical protein SKAU_G00385200 [Synaphobranchus kaupii]|uniref:C2H2-type domain-containing protein n=1 Tax=Synaphobranchus kaupii TaxID=118154 RepID=A0A9Q1EEH9_SYNKA|nr:hypothetical protein SKAU_G00385200 [Synaphobranchus kaupii]
MSSISSFHTQLASIMDVLTKAAVAEMCEIVDNGYAVLHLEISRSQKENKALKKKLHMLELRIARGSDDRIVRASSANSVQICDELRQTTPRKDEYFNIYTNAWDNGEHRTVDEDDTLPSTTDRSADKEKMRPESLLIKMEKLEEDFENRKPQGGENINEEKALESDGGERATIADSETESAMGIEELSEQRSTRHSVWEDSGLDTVLKAEPEMSRSQKENEALKRKLSLQTMELRIAKEARFPSAEIAFNSQLDISPWRDGMPTVDDDTQVHTKSNESADTVEVRRQSVHIKKETLEEDLENSLQGGLRIRQKNDGYAVLRLEISRSEKENQTLKRKLQMLELMAVRGYAEAGPRETSAANSRPDGPQAFDGSRGTERENLFAAAERAFGSQLGVSLWKDGEPTAVDEEDTSLASPMRDECSDLEEGRSQSLLIKEETLEEDLENGRAQEAVESDGGERAPIVDTQTSPAIGKEQLTDQHCTRHSVWEDGGLDTVLKAEPEIDTVNLEAENGAGRLNILDYEDIIHERSAQMPFTTHGIPEKDKEEAACSYPVESDSENLSVHSELLSGKSLSSLGSLDMKREDEAIDPELLKVEAEIRSAWSKEIMSGVSSSQHSYYGKDWESDELLLESDANVCTSQTEMVVRDNIADIRSNALSMNGWAPYDKSSGASRISETHSTNAREERFICTCCGKSFTCQSVFEAHQRTHVVEKPFNCSQCGKRFAQLSNLITHRRVHTGEKPYSCTHCGKQFAQSRYLVTHLRIHTGEKPFSCTHCGKRFAQSNNLVRHQSVHTGKKPFRCSQCGKSFTTSSHRKRHESVHIGGRPYTCTL